ncbi:hypothetical protein LX32DRAFT_131798 [Colletotrichum zoysiae]|uniref:Uncharacterized protein n=1 Tax=Colletotrichum zoysiae TaxID=1216348 RepID=A0AAD9H8F0_9PEZI|nr:hypothetical protein LX32DRAFT_131798 [Colletotrichum zoysiae]
MPTLQYNAYRCRLVNASKLHVGNRAKIPMPSPLKQSPNDGHIPNPTLQMRIRLPSQSQTLFEPAPGSCGHDIRSLPTCRAQVVLCDQSPLL